jgi:superfamily II DNA or RNA helicase
MLAILKRSALIVVPRSNLVDQWVERIAEHTDYPVNRIGVINGDIVKWEGYPITVALVHSIAARMTDNHSFHESFGVAVFDEVDRSVPPSTFSPILGLLPAKFRIGASATVKRKDGLHLISDSHIAQVKLKGRDVGRMTPKILIVRYSKSSGGLYMGGPKLNRRGMLLSKLAENPLRNQLICKYAKLIYKSGRRFIILSDRTAQLADLYWMLTRQGVKPIEMGFYCDSIATTKTGKKRKVKKEELERVASDCKILLGTYGKIAIGTDIPDLAGLIYATPQSDVRQTQGRIERMCEGKSQPVVVDIVDLAYPDAIGWSKARRRYYNQKGLTIKVI